MAIEYGCTILLGVMCIVLSYFLGRSEHNNKRLEEDLDASKVLTTVWFHAYNKIRKGVEKNRTLCDLEKEEIIYSPDK